MIQFDFYFSIGLKPPTRKVFDILLHNHGNEKWIPPILYSFLLFRMNSQFHNNYGRKGIVPLKQLLNLKETDETLIILSIFWGWMRTFTKGDVST